MAFRTMLIGATAAAVAGGVALAQSPFPPVGQASPFPPVGQQSAPPSGGGASPFPPAGSAFPPPPQQQQQCMEQFVALRKDVEKQFEATKAGLERRVPAAEMCKLLTRFTALEIKMMKYVEEKGPGCGFPPNALPSMKASHSRSMEYRKQACNAASAPRARPSEPSLSDVLSPPVANKDTTRTGRGTLDSLSGNPLAR